MQQTQKVVQQAFQILPHEKTQGDKLHRQYSKEYCRISCLPTFKRNQTIKANDGTKEKARRNPTDESPLRLRSLVRLLNVNLFEKREVLQKTVSNRRPI